MHLIVPFAAAQSDAGRQALHDLPLPQLERLLATLQPQPVDAADERTLSPPHERALASALGWTIEDGKLPFAARLARTAGAPDGELAWGLLTPLHLRVGTEQVSMTDPASLQLDDDSSRELLAIVRPLLDSEGFTLHYAGPLQWLAAHPSFDGLATASLDRVVGRNIDPWLPDKRAARLIRRIESEVQMLLYTHALNDRREAAGLPTVNAFWVSGCGRARPEAAAAPTLDERLRAPALAEDWVAWRDAWQQLDAGPIAALARHGGPVTLTLCGERASQSFMTGTTSLWQRVASTWRRPSLHTLLETL